jgi:hypothetical protein
MTRTQRTLFLKIERWGFLFWGIRMIPEFCLISGNGPEITGSEKHQH